MRIFANTERDSGGWLLTGLQDLFFYSFESVESVILDYILPKCIIKKIMGELTA
mgnify:CR=1 FL=1|jgi:hypothetical protein